MAKSALAFKEPETFDEQPDEVQIEHDVPIPERQRASNTKYPYAKMEIGDSFVARGGRSSVWNSTAAARRKLNMKFATRKQPDGSYRIWRIE